MLRGGTGLAVKGGEVRIEDSDVIATATDETTWIVAPTEDRLSGSGFIDTGDSIYIESSYGYPITLTVTGECNISHAAGISKAIRVFPEASNVKVQLEGGIYTSDVSEFIDEELYLCTSKTVEETQGEETVTKTVYEVTKKEEE